MSKKSTMKKIMVGTATILLVSSGLAKEAKAATFEQKNSESMAYSTKEGAIVYSTKKVWVYKTVNGKKYMRLYDTQREIWLTDWILCG